MERRWYHHTYMQIHYLRFATLVYGSHSAVVPDTGIFLSHFQPDEGKMRLKLVDTFSS